jgi:Tfp pilus assembly protein PilO
VAAFAADMAHMQRVVHMQDISIASRPDSSLTVDGTFRVYRQLDKAEAALANAVKADNK